jgi:uncharacterized pyridoxamine 5'-phosphate oxidase family protein
MNKAAVSEFLKTFETCVVATVNEKGEPNAATVGFSHDEDFSILIGTNRMTRKYANLQANPKIALVVGTEGVATVQYEGTARNVTARGLGERLSRHFEKVPGAKRFIGDENQIYFVIMPTWLRFTNYIEKPPVFEMQEF